jgi:hypothetical protein
MMCGNDGADLVQLPGRKSAIRGECQRIEPGLAADAVALHMNVHRLAVLEALEEEPMRSGDVRYRGHQAFRYRVVIVIGS